MSVSMSRRSKNNNGFVVKARVLNGLGDTKHDGISSIGCGSSFLPTRKPDDQTVALKLEDHLTALKPSQYLAELVDYYRKKVDDLLSDNGAVQRRLEQITSCIEEHRNLKQEMQAKDGEIMRLQRSMSELQDTLYQERDHVLRLTAENDRLRIKEQEDREKIHHLLNLTDMGPLEVTYFLKNRFADEPNQSPEASEVDESEPRQGPRSTLIIEQLIPRQNYTELLNSNKTRVFKNPKNERLEIAALKRQLESMQKTIICLRKQMELQSNNSNDQIKAALEERDNKQLELENKTQL
ncbi:Coiled-coil domain-containing protein 77, partial [Cichlidogyrus casuarinus]